MTGRGRLAVLAGLLLLLAGCGAAVDRTFVEGVAENLTRSPFYTPPSPVPSGKPGDIVRTEALPAAPSGTRAWRVMYHSTDLAGGDILTSGVVIAPDGPAPAGGRPVVAWAHPTTGAAAHCAPSNGIDPFDLIEGLPALLAAGYVVAAADYPGLGVEGQSSYLVGQTEGASVLDSVRAARHLPEAGAGDQVLLWGHSQGGHAVLFAAQLARSYAPELQVKAAAVAAPAADLATLFDDDLPDPDASGVAISSYAFATYATVYKARFPGLSLASVLTAAGAAKTPRMAQLCLLGQHAELHATALALVGKYTRTDPGTTEPWATMLSENTPGAEPLGVPLLVNQGDADTLVRPSATARYVAQACAAGEYVVSKTYPGETHGTIALAAMPTVTAFFTAVLAGTPPASTC